MSLVAQNTTPRGLVWAFASVSSIAIHTALVAAILTAARFSQTVPPETQISIATMESTALAASSPPKGATIAPAASSATTIRAERAEPERIAGTEKAKAVSGRAEPDRVQAAKATQTAAPRANDEVARTAPAANIARPADQAEVVAVRRPDVVEKPSLAETALPVERPDAATRVEPAAPATLAQAATPAPAPLTRAEIAGPFQPSPPAQTVARAETAAPAAAVAARPPATAVQPAKPATAPGIERMTPAAASAAAPQPAETVAGLVPAPAKPAQPESRTARVASFLRGYQGGRCFLAVPAGGEKDLHLRVFSDRSDAFSTFRSQSADAVDVYAEPAPVGEAQCLALNFARSLPRYPDFGLRIDLDSADVVSGASLTGHLVTSDAPSVYLLTVDDDGMVVKANRSLKPGEQGVRPFAIQMFLTDTPKTPTQLLIAISSDRPVEALEMLRQAPAADLFAKLKADDETMDFAIVAFVVR